MKGKSRKNKKIIELNIIFFIIMVSTIILIMSTYAWLSSQTNVSINNLQGIVKVAEGLEISLDALNWTNKIVLGTGEGELNIINNAYSGHRNLSPSEMLPVSTLGLVNGNMTDLKMLRGNTEVSEFTSLADIVAMNETIKDVEDPQFPGYFAFDIFLKNSSRMMEKDDILQLNYDSSVEVLEAEKSITGLQNTVRVAFAKYDGTSDVLSDQTTVLRETGANGGQQRYITDIAIWEPNSNDHAEYIFRNNNNITWSNADAQRYATTTLDEGKRGFGMNSQIPTYAIKESAINSRINNIYLWDGSESLLQKQVTLQTTKTSDTDYKIAEGVQNLISTSDTGDKSKTFALSPNRITRVRVYVWLEGQDVDCINYASHGGGIKLNIGLVKGSKEGSQEPQTNGGQR